MRYKLKQTRNGLHLFKDGELICSSYDCASFVEMLLFGALFGAGGEDCPAVSLSAADLEGEL